MYDLQFNTFTTTDFRPRLQEFTFTNSNWNNYNTPYQLFQINWFIAFICTNSPFSSFFLDSQITLTYHQYLYSITSDVFIIQLTLPGRASLLQMEFWYYLEVLDLCTINGASWWT